MRKSKAPSQIGRRGGIATQHIPPKVHQEGPVEQQVVVKGCECLPKGQNEVSTSVLTPPLSASFDQYIINAMDEIEELSFKHNKSVKVSSQANRQVEDQMDPSTAATQSSNANQATRDLQLTSWNLPQKVLKQYASHGIFSMYPWQAQCLMLPGVLGRTSNLVYSAPTSAGKTLVAELLAIKCIFEAKKKVLFILPFVSVTHEKEMYFKKLLEPIGLKIGGFHGGQSPSGGLPAVDLALCTIEKANSLVNGLLEEGSMETIGAVVVDELHMIGDPHRGYLLELLLTKLLYTSKKACLGSEKAVFLPTQIIGMSATLPNLSVVAKWLDAQLYSTDFRPVPLNEMFKAGPVLYSLDPKGQFVKMKEYSQTSSSDDEDNLMAICWESVSEGHSVLIFCPTKSRCESLAALLAKSLLPLISKLELIFNQAGLIGICEQLRRTQVGLDPALESTVPSAVAFHHAGLTFEEREIIEGGFRQCHIKVLVATSTLSSGVNLPARRVIIRSPTFHGSLLGVQVYKQMVGRAGRKGVDCLGESILVCKPSEMAKARKLILGSLQPISSCLGGTQTTIKAKKKGNKETTSSAMKRAILEIISSGSAVSYADIEMYASSTLLFVEMATSADPIITQKALVDGALMYLLENDLIRLRDTLPSEGDKDTHFLEKGYFYVSQLGTAAVVSSLGPENALIVFAELRAARKAFVLDNELHLIYLVTPISVHEQWPSVDWYLFIRLWESLPPDMKHAAEVIGVSESFLFRAASGRVPSYTAAQQRTVMIHRRFYASMALQDLVNEAPISQVAAKYSASKGLIQSLQTTAGMFAGMVTAFCQRLGWHNLELLLSQFQSRLTFGVERELSDLVRISLLNGQRARCLFTAGYHTIVSLATANPVAIEKLFRNSVPFKSYKVQKEVDLLDSKGKVSVSWCSKLRRGLTEYEAAKLIVEEAQQILSQEMNVPLSVWKKEQKTPNHTAAGDIPTQVSTPPIAEMNCSNNSGSAPERESSTSKVLAVCSAEEKVEELVIDHPLVTSLTSRIQRKSPPQKQSHANLKKLKISPHDSDNIAANLQSRSPFPNPSTLSYSDRKASTPLLMDIQSDKKRSTKAVTGSLLLSPINMSLVREKSTPSIVQSTSSKARAERVTISDSFTESILSPLSANFPLKLTPKSLACFDDVCKEQATSSQQEGVPPPPSATSSLNIISDSLLSPTRSISLMEMCKDIRMSDLECSAMEVVPSTPPNLLNVTKSVSTADCSESVHDKITNPAKGTSASFHELSSLCATQDDESGLTIIDVTANIQLFQTFLLECAEQSNLSISLATRPALEGPGVGLDRQYGSHITEPGLPIPYSNMEAMGVAVCWEGWDVYYISLCDCTNSDEVDPNLSIPERLHQINNLLKGFEATNITINAFDVKKHLKDLALISGNFPSVHLSDPKVADWLLNPDCKEKTLSKLVLHYLPNQPHLLQNGTTGEIPLTTLATHGPTAKIQAAAESVLSVMLMQSMKKLLQSEFLHNPFTSLEMPLQISLAKMELLGIGFSEVNCKKIEHILQSRMRDIEYECYQLANHPFSLTSPEDVSHVLFIELRLPSDPSSTRGRAPGQGKGKRKTQHLSTAKAVLEKITHLHPLPSLILEWRRISSTLSKVVYPLSKESVWHHGLDAYRVHAICHFHTSTGRVNMSSPNLQNVPKMYKIGEETPSKNDLDEDELISDSQQWVSDSLDQQNKPVLSICMRSVFVPADGNIFLAADYSQLELRILAHLSGDERLLGILNGNGDVFKMIASKWLKKAVSKVSTGERQQAKSICYGMVYGIGVKSLSEQLKVTEDEAVKFLDSFKAQFPKIQQFIDETIGYCRNNGYISTLLCRKRLLPAIHSTNIASRTQAERQAINSTIQGSAADIVKLAMIKLDGILARKGCYGDESMWVGKEGGQLILQIHDELLFEVEESCLLNVAKVVKWEMENVVKLQVQLPIKFQRGPNWGELREYCIPE